MSNSDQPSNLDSEWEYSDSRTILPPIREAIPEINEPSNDAGETSRAHGRGSISHIVASPTMERRRIQSETEEDSLSRHVPRIYRAPRHRVSPSPGLSPSSRSSERWNTPATASPVTTMGIPAPVEIQIPSPGPPRVALPILTLSRLTIQSLRSDAGIELELPSRSLELPRPYGRDYPMYHPQSLWRLQSPSPPIGPYDRTPSSSGVYPAPHFSDAAYFGDLIPAPGTETKPRKRRGNLPKETTDKLRAWFMAHLSHPYPTEDEKQDLMRQTGLQMNQISNWFINARRRQLPALAKKQREADARNSGRAIPSREGNSAASPAASDGDSTLSDSGIEVVLRHRRLLRRMKRVSL